MNCASDLNYWGVAKTARRDRALSEHTPSSLFSNSRMCRWCATESALPYKQLLSPRRRHGRYAISLQKIQTAG